MIQRKSLLGYLVPALFLCALAWADAPPNISQIAQAVDDHYDHLRTLQAQFTELYEGAGMQRTES